jgi:hypothetical protein
VIGVRSIPIAAALVAALLFQTACNSSAIADAAKAEAAIETACNSAFQVVVQGNQEGLITLADAVAINAVILKIEQANGQALTATAKLNSLSAANQANLLAILQPVLDAINGAVVNGTVGIKDPATQQKVLLALTTIQTAATAAVAILKAVKTQ